VCKVKSFSILIILIFCFAISVLSQNSENKDAVDLYKKALEYYNKGEIEKAIEALEKSLKLDGKFSDARIKLAEMYLNQESVKGRVKAEMELKKVLKDDPENVDYQINLGKIYLKKGFIYEAKRYFESLAEKYPNNAEVLSNLGNIYALEYERYKNSYSGLGGGMDDGTFRLYEVVSSPSNYSIAGFYDDNLWSYVSRYGVDRWDRNIYGIPIDTKKLVEYRVLADTIWISLSKWADEDYRNALSSFDKVIEIEPEHRDAHFQLGILAYDNNDLNTFIDHQRKIIGNNLNDKNAHLFLGLGLHETNENEEAFEEFELAKGLMDEDERMVFESLDYILPKDEAKEYHTLSGIEQERFVNNCWKSKDPLYLTELSERMLEHYSRVAYANLKFGVPRMGIEGWESERGRIYIRYGKAHKERKISPGARGAKIIWYYPDYTFIFTDRYYTGNFQLLGGLGLPGVPQIDFEVIEEDVRKTYPEGYEHNYGGELFAFNYYTASFKSEDGNTHMEIYYSVPQKYIQYNPDRGRFSAKVKKGFFIFDEDWNDVKREIYIEEFGEDTFPDTSKIFHILDQKNLEIKPGEYQLAIEIQDESSENTGISREMISVESFETDSLKLSDIVFAAKIDTEITKPEFSSRGLEIIPNPVRLYTTNQPLYVYYEIYNLRLTAPGLSNYTVEYKINKYDEKGSPVAKLFSGIGRIFGIGDEKEEISTSYEYSGYNPTEKQYLTINIKDAEPGVYQLSLTVSDVNSGQKVTKERTLLITGEMVDYLY